MENQRGLERKTGGVRTCQALAALLGRSSNQMHRSTPLEEVQRLELAVALGARLGTGAAGAYAVRRRSSIERARPTVPGRRRRIAHHGGRGQAANGVRKSGAIGTARH
jgi:hypothetical protein